MSVKGTIIREGNIKKFCYDYEMPAVTVDIVIFTVKNEVLQVLLVKRKDNPAKGDWSLPGGFVRIEESLDFAAAEKLEEKAGVKHVYLEQLYTFGDPLRDSRGRVITVAYFALVNFNKIERSKDTDLSNTEFFPINNIPKNIVFDHKKILETALKRLQSKLEYTTIVFSLLPDKFTLTQLQQMYELILNKKLDKRNFRKKISSLNIIKKIREKTEKVSHRPAQLFQFSGKLGEIIEIL